MNPHEFMVSTQVPSLKDKENIRHEGLIFTLTEDGSVLNAYMG